MLFFVVVIESLLGSWVERGVCLFLSVSDFRFFDVVIIVF